MPGDTAASRQPGILPPLPETGGTPVHHRCPRCGEALHQRKSGSLQAHPGPGLVTAVVLYIPANVLPIMITDQLGSAEPSTILGGSYC